MATPRPRPLRLWTQADHEANARQFQKDADRKVWDKLGRAAGIRGRELAAAVGRLLDERIAAAFRTMQPSLLEQLNNPATSDALRGTLFDLISDDVVEMFQILNGQVDENERSDTEEVAGSGGENATYEQREIYGDEAEEAET